MSIAFRGENVYEAGKLIRLSRGICSRVLGSSPDQAAQYFFCFVAFFTSLSLPP
jgi:hypothetical protein